MVRISRGIRPSIEHSRDVTARWERERAAGTRFTVRDESTNAFLGDCELRPPRSISYWTYPAHRGRGVAAESVRLLCEWARTRFGLTTLEAEVDYENVASQKVLIASGFQTERIASLRISRWVKKFTAGSSR